MSREISFPAYYLENGYRLVNWTAKWIWDDGEEQPRNYWVCFRKCIEIQEPYDEIKLKITGDSRYYLYINNEFQGNGPVRSWPFELSFDTYEIKHLLQNGKNMICVLVHHYGISTFQYIEGRGGLFVQIEFYKDGKCVKSIGTDDSWKNHIHSGYERNNVRLSLQQGWAEIYDADNPENGWCEIGFDDRDWSCSTVIGDCGDGPWTGIKERDIQYLTDELIYPKKVISLKDVVPIRQHASIDYRTNFFPDEKDANWKGFAGILGCVMHSQVKTMGKMVFWTYNHAPGIKRMRLNGKEYSLSFGVDVDVELEKGENLLLIDVSGDQHELFLHMAYEFDEEIQLSVPGFEDMEFFTVGPFFRETLSNYREEFLYGLPDMGNEFKKAWDSQNVVELLQMDHWVQPILAEFACRQNVFTMISRKKDIKEYTLPYQIHNMVIPNSSYSYLEPTEYGDKEIIVDFGTEVSGYIEFDIEAENGAVIDIYGFEHMDDDEIVLTYSLNNFMRYVSSGGRHVYRSMIRRGYRYLMLVLRNYSLPVRIYRILTHLSTYPVADVGKFECSDYQLNKIWEICQRTTRLCMEDTFVDCPAYEQVFWVGDCRNEALVSYYQFGAYDIVKRSLRLIVGSIYRSGVPESHVPSGWHNIIPAWSMLWMTACKEYFEYTGDLNFAEQIYPELLRTIEGYKRYLSKEGLISIEAWNMLDWAGMDTPRKGIVTHQNALFVKAVRDMIFIAEVLNRQEDILSLQELADGVRKSINDYLWCSEKNAYIDSIHFDGTRSEVISQQTNIMVYFCDCAEGERKEIIESYLIEPPQNFITVNSPFMSFFYMEALLKYRQDNDTIEYILKHIKKEWGQMLEKGSTTCWETFGSTRSYCHAWSAAPGYFLGTTVLGVKLSDPGFKKVVISPNICGLTWARGTVPLPNGRLDVAWNIQGDTFNLNIKIPKGIEYTIVLPERVRDSCIKVNGKIFLIDQRSVSDEEACIFR